MKQSGLGSQCTGLFSTTVLGGSSSAPNLQDYARSHRKKISAAGSLTYKDELLSMPAVKRFSVSFAKHPTNGFEGCSMVPTIYPLETLHNSLSLRQVNEFLSAVCKQFAETHSRSSSAGCDSHRHTPGDACLPHRILSSSSLPLRQRSERPPWYSSGPSSTVSSAGPSSPTTLDLSSRFNFNEKTSLTEEQRRKLNLDDNLQPNQIQGEEASSSQEAWQDSPPVEEPLSHDSTYLAQQSLCDLAPTAQPCMEEEVIVGIEAPGYPSLPYPPPAGSGSMVFENLIHQRSVLDEQMLTELSLHGQETSL